MPKSKKYIDKKQAVTFRLVHRSQQDPLIADENAPQRVLQAVDDKVKKEKEKRIEEQQKFGIYFDDDYDYLQHLRDVEKKMEWEEVERIPAASSSQPKEQKIMLPSSVFASEVEEEVGMLNKAAPQSGLRLDLDPDIVAALDDDFDFSDPENELEDNFMELANAQISDIEEEGSDCEYSSDGDFAVSGDEEDGEQDDGGAHKAVRVDRPANTARSLGGKSRFTEYSHTSYAPDRPETLKHLDARFEKFMEKYDDDQIGALEGEDIEGHIDPNSDVLLKLAEDFEKESKLEQLPTQDPEMKDQILKRVEDMGKQPEKFEYVTYKAKPEYDCVSILSTYSNIYNRPKRIEIEPIKKRKKVPNNTPSTINEKNDSDYSTHSGSSDGVSMISKLSTISIRPKNETPEEKRERKQNFKAYKREKRVQKKLLKQTFSEDKKRVVKVDINRANNRGQQLA